MIYQGQSIFTYVLIYYSSQHHKTLYFQMQFISIGCSNNLRESIKLELVLNRPKKCITKKRKLENSQAPEMLSAKKTKNSYIEQVYFRNR